MWHGFVSLLFVFHYNRFDGKEIHSILKNGTCGNYFVHTGKELSVVYKVQITIRIKRTLELRGFLTLKICKYLLLYKT